MSLLQTYRYVYDKTYGNHRKTQIPILSSNSTSLILRVVPQSNFSTIQLPPDLVVQSFYTIVCKDAFNFVVGYLSLFTRYHMTHVEPVTLNDLVCLNLHYIVFR